MATLKELAMIVGAEFPGYPYFKAPATDEDNDRFFKAWHRYLGHLSSADLQAAMHRAVINSPEYFPSHSAVLKAAGELAAGSGKTALEAWGVVQRAMTTHGNYHGPKGSPLLLEEGNYEWVFDDDAIQAAVIGLGWRNLFEGDQDVMRSHFIRAYDAYQLRAIQRAALPELQKVKELQHG